MAAALLVAAGLPPALANEGGTFTSALQAAPAMEQHRAVRTRPEIPASLRTTLNASLESPRSPAEIWAARQWFNDMEPRLTRFVKDPARRTELLHRAYHEARLAGLPPELVLAVIQVESAFQAEAVSSAGAVGLMQIMPFWIRELGLPADDLKDPWRNLRYGCTILAHYLAVERGDLTRALARYNGSLGQTWYPERVMRAWQRHWRQPGEGGSRAAAQR
ncbi:transglycosylase SLT domain-containing protein [Halomonas sp. LBP4]|uniref:transglycosylase SLT domain-containing protein n=1 Tax=Halomonas sp. LBP4 TaxID=2044917 RepID=UPI000D752D8B|nr:lytic murein transglycosylase [Halomonas sp. LBP4]